MGGAIYSVFTKRFPWKFGDKAFDYGPALRRCESVYGNGNCRMIGPEAFPKCYPGYRAYDYDCHPIAPNCSAYGMSQGTDIWSCYKASVKFTHPWFPCDQNRDHKAAAFKEVKIEPLFDFCWRDERSQFKTPRGWVECGFGAATNTPICVEKIFAQIGAVFVFIANMATLGAINAVKHVVSVVKSITEIIENGNKVNKAIWNLKGVVQYATEAKTLPATHQQLQHMKIYEGQVSPDFSTRMGRETFAIQTAQTVTDLIALVDPFGVFSLAHEYTYPVCSVVKGLEF